MFTEGGYVTRFCCRRLFEPTAVLMRLTILPNRARIRHMTRTTYDLPWVEEFVPIKGLSAWVVFDDGLKGEIDLSCLSDRSYAKDWHCPDGFTSVKLEAGVPMWGGEELSPSYLKGLLEKTHEGYASASASHHSRTMVG